MKKILFFLLFFILFIPFIKAETYITDYIDINDKVTFVDDNNSFNIVKIERNDRSFLYLKYSNTGKKYMPVVILYDEMHNEIDRITQGYYSSYSDSIFLDIDLKEIKYYKLILKVENKEKTNSYNEKISDEEIENAIKIKTDIIYSDNNKELEKFYFDNFIINLNTTKVDEKKYEVIYEYNFDIIANEDIEEFEFYIPKFDYYGFKNDDSSNNLEVFINNESVRFGTDYHLVKLKDINRGKTSVIIKYTILEEYSSSYGIYLNIYKNIYENNIYDYFKVNVYNDYNINVDNSTLFCGYDTCMNYYYNVNGKIYTADVKGHFDKDTFGIFVVGDSKSNFFDKIKDIFKTKSFWGSKSYIIILGIIAAVVLAIIVILSLRGFATENPNEVVGLSLSIFLCNWFVNFIYCDYDSEYNSLIFFIIVSCFINIFIINAIHDKKKKKYLIYANIFLNVLLVLLDVYTATFAYILLSIIMLMYIKIIKILK
ncbi:MAG: hypothetical protein IKR57_03370 [Bacilli bacterium]|nr:hypothetical protein [Bacilli bacterium]